MSLRRRLALVAATAVAAAVILAVIVCYMVVRGQLRGQVDDALRAQAAAVQQGDVHSLQNRLPGISASAGGPAPYAAYVGPDGTTVGGVGDEQLPVGGETMSVASGHGGTALSDVQVGDAHLRAIVFAPQVPVYYGGQPVAAIELARPLSPVDRVLSRLRLILLLVCAGGVALAALLGRLAAGRVIAPLSEVARTAQHVSETEDLSARIHVQSVDEVGQLATRFNAMIERLQSSRSELDESVRAQRQLVADASHELRTPVTSLRTNIEVLLAGGDLDPADRDRLLTDVVEQTEELSALVNDLIELARGDLPLAGAEELRLDRIVEEALGRARRHAPSIAFEADLEAVVLRGVPERLGRAIGNLLDNAARHSPPAGAVEVGLHGGELTVRDHGGGFDQADLPYVFDRFFRGTNSRGRQGSGLGLAIVKQVVEQHGGTVQAENAPDGGGLLRARLPVLPAHDARGVAPGTAVRPVAAPAPGPAGRP